VTGPQDQWLAKLFDQSEKQHDENRKDVKKLLDMVAALTTADGQHGLRLTALEAWKEKTVDPFLATARDGISQAKGVGKVTKFFYSLGMLVGGGVLYKLGAAVLAALPK